jgi:hypothetical protein
MRHASSRYWPWRKCSREQREGARMSDREFENYLTLLASLLRLDGGQRKQIAEELRAHLEDRLDELVALGAPHDEAVQRALAEFGDAAGLAASFVKISRGRKRRWIMRVTSFSIAATLLIAAGLFTFWPGRNAAPGAAETLAQVPAVVAAGETPKKNADARDAEVNDILNQRMDIDYEDMPLKDVATALTDRTGVTFYLNAMKLNEASVSPEAPITSHFRRIRLSTWLELALGQHELTYVIRDDIVVITTPEDAENELATRVYDCRDLLAMPAPPGADKFLPARPSPGMGGMGGGMFAVEDQPKSPTDAGGGSGPPQAKGPWTVAPPGGVPASPTPSGGAGGGFSYSGGPVDQSSGPLTEHDLRADNLMNLIMENIDPNTWDDVGGVGSISEYNGLFVVTQTTQTHKKVERVLDMLREAAGLPGPGKVVR